MFDLKKILSIPENETQQCIGDLTLQYQKLESCITDPMTRSKILNLQQIVALQAKILLLQKVLEEQSKRKSKQIISAAPQFHSTSPVVSSQAFLSGVAPFPVPPSPNTQTVKLLDALKAREVKVGEIVGEKAEVGEVVPVGIICDVSEPYKNIEGITVKKVLIATLYNFQNAKYRINTGIKIPELISDFDDIHKMTTKKVDGSTDLTNILIHAEIGQFPAFETELTKEKYPKCSFDWYLPSADELIKMLNNVTLINNKLRDVFGANLIVSDQYYWSSSYSKRKGCVAAKYTGAGIPRIIVGYDDGTTEYKVRFVYALYLAL